MSILTLDEEDYSNVLLFVTTKQKEELQPFKPTNWLPKTNLILGNFK